MTTALEKLVHLRDQGATSALAGANQVMMYVNEGKLHLVYPFYQEVYDAGDYEKARGVKEILDVINRQDLIKSPMKQVHYSASHQLGQEILDKKGYTYPEEEFEFFLNLDEGRYTVLVELEGDDSEFVYELKHQTDCNVDYGVSKGSFQFDIEELESGIIKFILTPLVDTLITSIVVKPN